MLLHKALSRSYQEAFSRDSKLVQKARVEYYQENFPHFNNETSCNMTDIFQSMIKSASLTKFWNPQNQGDLDWAEGTAVCQLCPNNPVQRVEILPTSVPLRVPKGHGPHWYPPSQCTPSFQWGNPSPMVWERRAKWRNCHWSSVDDPLQIRAGVWKMLPLSLSHIWGHPAPCPQKLLANPRRGPWWIILIYLTAPWHWHQWVPWSSLMKWKHEMHHMWK